MTTTTGAAGGIPGEGDGFDPDGSTSGVAGVGGAGRPHPAYRRLADSVSPGGPGPVHARVCPTAVCPRCDAAVSCCHCAADVAEVRRFATRMAMIHQPTGTPTCGCGTHNCYVRKRLDDIWRRFRR